MRFFFNEGTSAQLLFMHLERLKSDLLSSLCGFSQKKPTPLQTDVEMKGPL